MSMINHFGYDFTFRRHLVMICSVLVCILWIGRHVIKYLNGCVNELEEGGEIDESSVICCPLVGSVAELSEKPTSQRLPRTHGGKRQQDQAEMQRKRAAKRVIYTPQCGF